MEKRVLITGVAGFIGSNLLDFLLENTDWNIDGIDNLSTGSEQNIQHRLTNERFTFINDDVKSVRSLLPYNCIFHLAALPRIQPSFELVNAHVEANVLAATGLLELMIRENHFPRFVYSGSSAVYGTPTEIPTSENERIDCLSPYAFQKYEVERYLELLSTRYPINYVTLRYFNPYGPRSFNPANKFNAYSSVVGIFLDRKKNGKPLLVTGDGSQQRDFIHVADLASANYKAAICEGRPNTFFNIGFGSTMSVLELARTISESIEFIEKREGEAEITFADVRKANSILGWKPTHKLSDYIASELKRL
jgi:nucleoside-diphosphate-sugar epimerase